MGGAGWQAWRRGGSPRPIYFTTSSMLMDFDNDVDDEDAFTYCSLVSGDESDLESECSELLDLQVPHHHVDDDNATIDAMLDGMEHEQSLNSLMELLALRRGRVAASAVDALLGQDENVHQQDALSELLQAEEEQADALLKVVLVPPVSEDTCRLHGWPASAFAACTKAGCSRQCMARLAGSEPDLLDRITANVGRARATVQQRSTVGAAAAASCSSIFCGSCGVEGSAASALLDGTVAAAAEAAAAEAAPESEEEAVLRSIRELQERGACRKSALTFAGRSVQWLHQPRKRAASDGSGKPAGKRLAGEQCPLPTPEEVVDAMCCGCAPRVPVEAILLLRSDPSDLAIKAFLYGVGHVCNRRMTSIIRISRRRLARLRRELREDGCPLPRERLHGLVAYRVDHPPANKTSAEQVRCATGVK